MVKQAANPLGPFAPRYISETPTGRCDYPSESGFAAGALNAAKRRMTQPDQHARMNAATLKASMNPAMTSSGKTF